MRQIVSISLQKDTVTAIEKALEKKDVFRNKSHFFEYAVKKALWEMKE